MPRKLDQTTEALLKSYGLKPSEALWDCHGNWVMYHWAVEVAAAKAGVEFSEPHIIEASGADKIVALWVMAHLGDNAAWWIVTGKQSLRGL